ncbi:MAG: alpha/beta fold hydrolase [Ignavibacteriae bacterium]|nr:alpha/beta fold hydrolase [Ignavibacteriota bacterium]
MKTQYTTTQNGDATISYISVNSHLGGTPIIIIPGVINSADEVYSAMQGHLDGYHIIISLRGRGESSSPETGYSLSDQASDINAVIENENLQSVVIFGHSLGSTIGIKAASIIPEKVKGFLMGDFPPFYPPYDERWTQHVLSFIDNIEISEKAVLGIAKDAAYADVSKELNDLPFKVLAIRARGGNTQLREEDAEKLKEICPNCEVTVLEESGHELMSDNPKGLAAIFKEYMYKVSLAQFNFL